MNSLKVDIRWKQRFVNFKKALIQLEGAVSLSKQRELPQLEKRVASVRKARRYSGV